MTLSEALNRPSNGAEPVFRKLADLARRIAALEAQTQRTPPDAPEAEEDGGREGRLAHQLKITERTARELEAQRDTAIVELRKAEKARDEAESESEDLTGALDRLSDLLRRTADALKGPPPELTHHDWSDLPDVVARAWRATGVAGQVRGLTSLADVVATLKSQRDEAKAELAEYCAYNERASEAAKNLQDWWDKRKAAAELHAETCANCAQYQPSATDVAEGTCLERNVGSADSSTCLLFSAREAKPPQSTKARSTCDWCHYGGSDGVCALGIADATNCGANCGSFIAREAKP